MPHFQTNTALGLPVQKLRPYVLQASDKTITLPLQICGNAPRPNLSRLINGSLLSGALQKAGFGAGSVPHWPLPLKSPGGRSGTAALCRVTRVPLHCPG